MTNREKLLRGRRHDARTDSYTFPGGSGAITREQIERRELLKLKLDEPDLKPAVRAGIILKILTFFSHGKRTNK
jgi:hypothetical protein